MRLYRDVKRNLKALVQRILVFFIQQVVNEQLALIAKDDIVDYNSERDPRIIVSLTSYGKRVDTVHLVLGSLSYQTLKPNMVVLCLPKSECNLETIPLELKKWLKRGLTINFCDDIGPYTKLIPTMKEYPEDIIITVDDDSWYDVTLIEKLYSAYLQDNSKIYSGRGHRITFNSDGSMKPYMQWDMNVRTKEKDENILLTGIGGVLYPPGCLYEDVCNEDLFRKLAPKADDLWFWKMSELKGSKREIVMLKEPVNYRFADETALQNTNVFQNKNDIQLRQIEEYYRKKI